jgi:hypothetical protein
MNSHYPLHYLYLLAALLSTFIFCASVFAPDSPVSTTVALFAVTSLLWLRVVGYLSVKAIDRAEQLDPVDEPLHHCRTNLPAQTAGAAIEPAIRRTGPRPRVGSILRQGSPVE